MLNVLLQRVVETVSRFRRLQSETPGVLSLAGPVTRSAGQPAGQTGTPERIIHNELKSNGFKLNFVAKDTKCQGIMDAVGVIA